MDLRQDRPIRWGPCIQQALDVSHLLMSSSFFLAALLLLQWLANFALVSTVAQTHTGWLSKLWILLGHSYRVEIRCRGSEPFFRKVGNFSSMDLLPSAVSYLQSSKASNISLCDRLLTSPLKKSRYNSPLYNPL